MGRRRRLPSSSKQSTSTTQPSGAGNDAFIHIDPALVRFQHSRIRPYFSGCGRSVLETLDMIRSGKLAPSDLPPIQVIAMSSWSDTATEGSLGDTVTERTKMPNNGTTGIPVWYCSLNNRRLWVLKRCREEGLLESTNNLVRVRLRTPKSRAEALRYSLQNCVLEAKMIREGGGGGGASAGDPTIGSKSQESITAHLHDEEDDDCSSSNDDGMIPMKRQEEKGPDNINYNDDNNVDSSDGADDSDSDGACKPTISNRFSALLL